jgi:hypothetical protein
MTPITILIIILSTACVVCYLTARSVKRTLSPVNKKPSAKILKMQREYRELIDYKLDMEYTKTKTPC